MLGVQSSSYKRGPVLAWESLTGLGSSVWSSLWNGNGFDLYRNADFTPQATAVANQDTTGLIAGSGFSRQAMGLSDGSNDSFEAAAVGIVQPAAGRDRIWTLVFKPITVGATRDLFGWRDPATPFAGCDIQILAGLTWTGRYDWGAGDLPFTHGGALTLGNWYVATLMDKQSTSRLLFGTTASGGAAADLGATAGVATSSTQPFAWGEARTATLGGQIVISAFGDVTGLGWGTTEIDALNSAIAAGIII